MNKLTRSLSLVTAAAMLVSLAACSSSSESTASSEPAAEQEHLTISAYYPMHPSDVAENIPDEGWLMDRMYEEKFNVTFDWYEVPATNEEEIYNITMASGAIPDLVFQSNWTKLNKYKDAWWVLDDFIKGKYPILEDLFFNDSYNYALSANADGVVQVISMLSSQHVGDGLLIRGDLVEDWGITIKNDMTKEEFEELLKLAKEKDPNIMPYMTRMKLKGMIQRLCEGWSGIQQDAFVDAVDNTVKYGGADAHRSRSCTS